MILAKINEVTHEVETRDHHWKIDGIDLSADIREISPGHYHLLSNGRGYEVEVVAIDRKAKKVSLKVNGISTQVELRDNMDLLLEKMGMHATQTQTVNFVKAPMPGMIIDLRVKVGDEVQEGDPLLILEAMKMENIIKSPGHGRIKAVHAAKGDNVEKNFVIIDFE